VPRGRAWGQVADQPRRAAQREAEPQPAAGEPVVPPVAVGIRAGGPGADLLEQLSQGRQVGAAAGGGQEDRVRIAADVGRQEISPIADLPRPRRRDLPGGQRGRHRRRVH
jgi:hypothetical protein